MVIKISSRAKATIIYNTFLIFIILICGVLILDLTEKLTNTNPRLYTIQDIENWCCSHNDTISPTGENCTLLVGNFHP